MSRKCLIATFTIFASACAARGPSPLEVAELAKAQALLGQGCYTCLKESLALFEKQLTANVPPVGAREGAFDAALLLAMRGKELGILGDAAMITARAMVVPARQPLLDAAELFIGDTTGLDPDQRAQVGPRTRPQLEPDNPRRRALDALPASDFAARYVALAIDCEQPKLADTVDMKQLLPVYEGVPLMRFRLAICGQRGSLDAGTLRAADPRWTDTLYWEGRRELASSIGRAIDLPKVLSLFAQGREAFPSSVMLTMAWANANMIGEEFEGALSGFDDVLAGQPTHRDALNGRMQSLSYLLRHEDAVTAATRLLNLGTWHIADANYWRAWNRYHLKEYDTAWMDVENAIKGLSNSRVYMLAGLIAYARKDLPTAVARFDRAYELDSRSCDATWMSGLVSIDQSEMGIAAPKFTRGMSCFVSAAAAMRDDRAVREAGIAKRGTPPSAREQAQLDRLQRDADMADEKSAQSAYNAAQCYARTGQKAMALNLINVAIAHPKMSDKALVMKAAIEKLPN
jgi:tetratricopeptide (TPR) repeat protein